MGPGLQAVGLVAAILMAKVAGLDWTPFPPSASDSHTLSGYYGGAVLGGVRPDVADHVAERFRLSRGR